MAEKTEKSRRSNVGFGSLYRKGSDRDLKTRSEIGTVLGGQVWLVKPDKKAQAANPCIWMQAGAVEFKGCNNFYDCTRCKYDQGMKRKVDKGSQISWQDAMRKRGDVERVCRHTLTHRIERRLCAYDYQCASCDFDQFFEDVWAAKTRTIPSELQNVKGFDLPMGYYFHNGHTWVRIESGGYIRIGMDDFALKLFGKADSLELPVMGKELDQDVVGWDFIRDGHTAGLCSPINGVIMEVNSQVREKPGIANERPYEDGWLFTVHTPDIKNTVKSLMTDAQGLDWMLEEVNILEGMVEEVAGPLAADGGYLADDIYGNIPQLGWDRLTKTFLKS